jgi:ADP-ribose pyrophosphatase YjhB (NUDIX family)
VGFGIAAETSENVVPMRYACHDSAVTYCYECALPCDDNGSVPMCPSHGPRWKLVRNAPCAEVLLTHDGTDVLLIRRAHEPFQGCWGLPGGFVEYGEHPADAARREVLEEVGLTARLTDVLGVYNDPHLDDIAAVMVFIGASDGTPQPDMHEVLEARWVAADELHNVTPMAPGVDDRLGDWARHRAGASPLGLGLDLV